MSCKECNDFQESSKVFYYRIETGNVAVQGCRKHVGIMFNHLRSHDALLEACKDMFFQLTLRQINHQSRCKLGENCPDKKALKLGEQAIAEAEK